MHDTLVIWDPLGIGFLSAQEGFDTATPLGRLLLNLLASLAEFVLATISGRVRAGLARAKHEGKWFGDRRIKTQPAKWQAVQAVASDQLIRRKADQQYGVRISTIQRTQVKLHRPDAGAGHF